MSEKKTTSSLDISSIDGLKKFEKDLINKFENDKKSLDNNVKKFREKSEFNLANYKKELESDLLIQINTTRKEANTQAEKYATKIESEKSLLERNYNANKSKAINTAVSKLFG